LWVPALKRLLQRDVIPFPNQEDHNGEPQTVQVARQSEADIENIDFEMELRPWAQIRAVGGAVGRLPNKQTYDRILHCQEHVGVDLEV
jgi:hypothetical protein